ncbi:uncharacterized protein [Amphiura filiformis]|uniref:uncharacterized protein isoform X1 n=1 Tax=Amphiura filiformis TaxID=82378 RepID=UPI003B21C16D
MIAFILEWFVAWRCFDNLTYIITPLYESRNQIIKDLTFVPFYLLSSTRQNTDLFKVNANAIRIYENAEIAEYKKKVTDLYDTAAKMGIPHACSPYWGLCYRPRSDEAAIS